MSDYRSRLRSSPKQAPLDAAFLPNMATDDFDFSYLPSFANSPSPRKGRHHELSSPHKSGYFLRTPSPLRKLQNFLLSPTKSSQNELPGTPSPHKPSSATDLFGNKSLLDNLDVPEDWDDHFLTNFQDDWLMGIGTEDIDSLGKSPLKSPGRGQTFLPSNTKTASPSVSPFKSPLLTSSPKRSGLSPLCWGKTPAANGNRPVTRQRKLFLHSPEKVHPPQPSNASSAVSWTAPIPFSSTLDASSSSAFSEGLESTSSLQSISSYLKNFDDDDVQEDLPVMPPAGWTSTSAKVIRTGKTGVKAGGKVKREKKSYTSHTKHTDQLSHLNKMNISPGGPQHLSGKKVKIEPQFTLLRPHTELHTHQISLRTTPVTPPNKVKISRDFSQIQTLPSKEQLRIVRNRFTETLNKAVEQVIEREKSKKDQNAITVGTSSSVSPAGVQPLASQYLTPGLCMPIPPSHSQAVIPQAVITMENPSTLKRKKR